MSNLDAAHPWLESSLVNPWTVTHSTCYSRQESCRGGLLVASQHIWSRRLLLFFAFAVVTSQSLMDLATTLMVLWGGWILWTARKEGRSLKWRTGFEWLFLAWFSWLAIGYIANWNPHLPWEKGLWEFRWMIEFIFYIVVIRSARLEEKSLRHLVWIALLVSAYSYLVYVIRWHPLSEPEWARYKNNLELIWRSGGVFGNPMPWAHTIGPLTCFFSGLFFVRLLRTRAFSWADATSMTSLGIATLLTMTRGVWIGVGITLPLMLWHLRKAWGVIFFLLMLLGGFVMTSYSETLRDRVISSVTGQVDYESQRIILWWANLEIFRSAPYTGWGYSENNRRLGEIYKKERLPKNQFQSHAHNQYLHFLAGTGAVGLLFYLSFLGLLFWKLAKASKVFRHGDPWLWGLTMGCSSALMCFFLNGMTESNFSIAKNRFLFLLIAALAVWVSEQVPPRTAPPREKPDPGPGAQHPGDLPAGPAPSGT